MTYVAVINLFCLVLFGVLMVFARKHTDENTLAMVILLAISTLCSVVLSCEALYRGAQ